MDGYSCLPRSINHILQCVQRQLSGLRQICRHRKNLRIVQGIGTRTHLKIYRVQTKCLRIFYNCINFFLQRIRIHVGAARKVNIGYRGDPNAGNVLLCGIKGFLGSLLVRCKQNKYDCQRKNQNQSSAYGSYNDECFPIHFAHSIKVPFFCFFRKAIEQLLNHYTCPMKKLCLTYLKNIIPFYSTKNLYFCQYKEENCSCLANTENPPCCITAGGINALFTYKPLPLQQPLQQ